MGGGEGVINGSWWKSMIINIYSEGKAKVVS